MTVHCRGEASEGRNDHILSGEAIRHVTIDAHHELQVVDDDVGNVVDVHGMGHCLGTEQKTGYSVGLRIARL